LHAETQVLMAAIIGDTIDASIRPDCVSNRVNADDQNEECIDDYRNISLDALQKPMTLKAIEDLQDTLEETREVPSVIQNFQV